MCVREVVFLDMKVTNIDTIIFNLYKYLQGNWDVCSCPCMCLPLLVSAQIRVIYVYVITCVVIYVFVYVCVTRHVYNDI